MENNVQATVHYPVPPHKQPVYQAYNHLTFEITEQIHNEVVSLPLNPTLTDAEVSYVIDTINNFCA